jgi:hypothetical protein
VCVSVLDTHHAITEDGRLATDAIRDLGRAAFRNWFEVPNAHRHIARADEFGESGRAVFRAEVFRFVRVGRFVSFRLFLFADLPN